MKSFCLCVCISLVIKSAMADICARGSGLRGHLVKKGFTILIGQQYFSMAEFVNKTVDEFLVVVERNAWRLEYMREDENIMGLDLVSSDRRCGFFDIRCSLGKLHSMLSKHAELELVAIVGARKQTQISAVTMTSPPPPMRGSVNTFGQAGAHVEVEEGTPSIAVNIADRNESYYEMQSLERNASMPVDIPVGVELESSMDAHAAEDPASDQVESDTMDSDALEEPASDQVESNTMDSDALEEPAFDQVESNTMDSDALEEPAMHAAGSDELDSSAAEEPAHANVVDEYIFPRKNPYLPQPRLRIEDMQPYFHLFGLKAAKKLKVTYAILRLAMRHLGIKQWPGTQVRVMEKAIKVLECAIATSRYEPTLVRKMKRALKSLKQKEDMLRHGTPAQVRQVLVSNFLVSKKVYHLVSIKLKVLWLQA